MNSCCSQHGLCKHGVTNYCQCVECWEYFCQCPYYNWSDDLISEKSFNSADTMPYSDLKNGNFIFDLSDDDNDEDDAVDEAMLKLDMSKLLFKDRLPVGKISEKDLLEAGPSSFRKGLMNKRNRTSTPILKDSPLQQPPNNITITTENVVRLKIKCEINYDKIKIPALMNNTLSKSEFLNILRDCNEFDISIVKNKRIKF